jgi:Protein of unknown function (DUF935)
MAKKDIKFIMLKDFFKDYKSKDVADLTAAIRTAEHPQKPNRYKLLQIYSKIWDDEHLSSVCQTRTLVATQIPFVLGRRNLPDIDDNFTKLICETSWFADLRKQYYDALFLGQTIVEAHFSADTGEIETFKLIPREYYEPSKRRYFPDPMNLDTSVSLDLVLLEYANLIEITNTQFPLGLLRKPAKSALTSSFIISNWAEFTDRFGQPYLVGKTDMRKKERVSELGDTLSEVGTGAAIIMGNEENLEILESSSRDSYNIFEKLIDKCEARMSKAILGQTMTTDNGSSLSQAQVHEAVLNGYTQSDLQNEIAFLNSVIKPFLIGAGYAISDYEFRRKPQDKFTPQEKINLINSLCPTSM